ncbi:MAG: hypothetical protein AB1742_15020 [bacterium]
MKTKEKKFITDHRGEKMAVILDIEDYEKLLEDMEELESIRAYDAAKMSKDDVLPFEKAIDEIEKNRT